MQGFSRVLAVVVAVVSVAFMGFAGVVTFGGPNWRAEADRIEGYTFSRSEGDNPQWSATRSEGREELSTRSAVLPEVVLAALQDKTRRAQEELQQLTEAAPRLQNQIESYQAMQQADYASLGEAYQERKEHLTTLQTEIEQARSQADILGDEVKKVEDQVASRREDVFRLQLQHRILLSDIARVNQNLQNVSDQIRYLEDELDKVQRRRRGLDEQGVPVPENASDR